MHLLERIHKYAQHFPERIAVQSGTEFLTWKELEEYSEILAGWIGNNRELIGTRDMPIAVYGHKTPWMLVCFLGCVKAGHAYCPIDTSLPEQRIQMILEQLPSQILFCPEPSGNHPLEGRIDENGKQVIDREALLTIIQNADAKGRTGAALQEGAPPEALPAQGEVPVLQPVSGARTWYIIFTSGSTGKPKGVQISADCLENFLDWSVGLTEQPGCGQTMEKAGPDDKGMVFLNQAPFSFDLSVMDLYTSLAMGGTLWCLDKEVQGDYAALMESLGRSGANVWVSTPSFARMCLSERTFDAGRMPALHTFLFCGETLDNRMAEKLMERFPDARIYNTYGPTESTVAVTGVQVTKEMAQAKEPLPIGTAKPGTRILIMDPAGNPLPDGCKGEIVIVGNTVSSGYYRQKELTEKAFFFLPGEDGSRLPAYRTGDEGWLQDGMLHYQGRIDFQVKLHGYRIELEDIENNIRSIPGVAQAVVLPNERGGKISSLTAYVTLDPEYIPEGTDRDAASGLKEELSRLVPAYMVPKKFEILDEIPVTPNGKADRKALRLQKTGGKG